MSDPLDRETFLAGYVAEAEEHLVASGKNLLAVEDALGRREPHPRAVRDLYRAVHTIKGLSGMVGVEPAVDIAHAMEEVLRRAADAGGRLTTGALDDLAQGLRALEARVRAVAEHRPVAEAPRALLDRLAAHAGEVAPSSGPATPLPLPPHLTGKLSPGELEQISRATAVGQRLFRVEFLPSPARAEDGWNITRVREALGAVAEVVRVVPVSVPRSAEAPAGLSFTLLVLHGGAAGDLASAANVEPERVTLVETSPLPPPPDRDAGEPDELVSEPRTGVVRVEVARLDAALELLGALVVTRMRMLRALGQLGEQGPAARALREIVDESGQQLRDLRAAIMQARMVSVAELLERVPLLVRGLGRATGKAVRLELDAGRAEVDKAVGERIFPAVVHLVRNAVDHAIEPPAERRAAGKPETGGIRVSCFERGDGRLELAVSDDGRGVDREAVARRAGRPPPRDDEELLELLALPGLSTASATTTTSGRGMGVDIVRRTAEELGGELRVETERGVGTTFTLRVPLSITIVDAFAFSSSGRAYVVPVSGVEEIIEVEPGRAARPPRPGSRLSVELTERRGQPVPLIRLDDVLGTARAEGSEASRAIVVRRGSSPFGFVVDRMLGQQEVVVRPVDDPLVKVIGIAGATDLGDGRPTLVLDLYALATRLAQPGAEGIASP
jgi:two-component system, chemotaxis family, sensor kinase CheA